MKIIKWLILLVVLVAAGFGAYHLYFIVMDDVERRISGSVRDGVGKGVVDTINPLKIPDKIFGGKK